MYNTILEEMNEFMNWATNEQKVEMVESLIEKLWEKCTTEMQKIELVSIFSDAMEEL